LQLNHSFPEVHHGSFLDVKKGSPIRRLMLKSGLPARVNRCQEEQYGGTPQRIRLVVQVLDIGTPTVMNELDVSQSLKPA
jgi:hypothetical protein